jgi:O-antigen ligase
MQKLSGLHKTAFKYLPVAILLTVVLYPKFPFIRIPGTFVSIRFEDLLIAFAALVFAGFVVTRVKWFLSLEMNRLILVYLFVGALSLAGALFVTKTVEPHIGIFHLLRRVEYFIPFFIGFTAIFINRKNLEYYMTVLVLLVFIVFGYGVGQKYFSWPMIVTQNEEYAKGVALRWTEGSHLNSTFAGHYDLATFMVMALPIIAALFFIIKNNYWKFVLFTSFTAGLWLLVVSASRMSLVAYLIAITFTLLLIKKYKFIPLVVLYSLLFIVFSSNLQARYLHLINVGRQRIEKTMTIPATVYAQELQQNENLTPTPVPVVEDRSTSIRLNVEWPRAVRAFKKNPLLGTGYSSITLATDNGYLRALGETGILGFLAFFAIFISLGRIMVKSFPFTNSFKGGELAFAAGITGAMPGIFANAVFIDVFEASKFALTFWLFVGMFVALSLKNNEKA